MKTYLTKLGIGLASLAVTALAPATEAAVYQFDFGGDSDAYVGTNSAGHATGAVDEAADRWVRLGHGFSNPVVDGYGNPTSDDISHQFGRTDGNELDPINWGWTVNNGTEGASQDGIYDTALMRHSVRAGDSSNNRAIGARLRGFEPGLWQIFVLIRPEGPHPHQGTVLVGTNVNSRSDEHAQVLELDANSMQPEAWNEGVSYVQTTIEIASEDDWLSIISFRDPENGTRGHIHGLQAVLVPEPASAAVLLTLVAGGLMGRPRRQRTAG